MRGAFSFGVDLCEAFHALANLPLILTRSPLMAVLYAQGLYHRALREMGIKGASHAAA
jgi:hypothetical protein